MLYEATCPATVPIPGAACSRMRRWWLAARACRRWVVAPVPLLCLPFLSAVADPPRHEATHAELVAEHSLLPADGGTLSIGLKLRPRAGWHLYWANPGDAGIAPKVDWHLPAGFSVGNLAFPVPEVIPFGPLITYGYTGDVLLTTELSVPAGLQDGRRVTITGKASWAVCDNATCVPEHAELSLELVAGAGPEDANRTPFFDAAKAKLPAAASWPARFSLADGVITVAVETPGIKLPESGAYLFPLPRDMVQYDEQVVSVRPDGITVTMKAHPRAVRNAAFPFVLSYSGADGNRRAVSLVASRSSEPLPSVGPASAPAPIFPGLSTSVDPGSLTAAMALLLAFFGGIVLNLMPCIFPILSMKVLGLAGLSGQDASSRRESGYLYAGGILVSFAIIGLLLVALRASGQAVGWGFQMQSPAFNTALGLLMLVIALNLFGVFEIGTRITGIGQALTKGGERRSAFFSGVLAVVVATPCTAPFMASALGFALVQPPFVAMAVFLSLGAGLAFPYVLFCLVPGAGRLLPRPGQWMITLRQILAFPMLATGIWLFWVVGRQAGADSMSLALLAALCCGFSLWAWGRGAVTGNARRWRLTALASAIPCLLLLYAIADSRDTGRTFEQAADDHPDDVTELQFTPETVANLIAAGQPVFVYFTADWCITCKLNESVALGTDTVAAAFAERDIAVVKGDWTSQDPVITEWLERYDRTGVPLYLYFPAGATMSTPAILPQILTARLMIEAIDEADARGGPGALHVLHDSSVQLENAATEIDSAIAIAESDVHHPKSFEAAELLLRKTHRTGELLSERELDAAIRLISGPLQSHSRLPELLYWLDLSTEVTRYDAVENLFARVASNADSALLRSLGAYYSGARLVRRMNRPGDIGDASAHRVKAAQFLERIDPGVLNEPVWRYRADSEELYLFPLPTFSVLQEELSFVLEHSATSGSADRIAAKALDGTPRSIAELRGQVVLLDFWATWCGSCMVSFPSLRELKGRLADDGFEIVALSIDEDREAVVAFLQENETDWVNWHIGADSEVWQAWAVRGTPTYVLLDAEGVVRGRSRELDDTFLRQIDDLLFSPGEYREPSALNTRR